MCSHYRSRRYNAAFADFDAGKNNAMRPNPHSVADDHRPDFLRSGWPPRQARPYIGRLASCDLAGVIAQPKFISGLFQAPAVSPHEAQAQTRPGKFFCHRPADASSGSGDQHRSLAHNDSFSRMIGLAKAVGI